MQNLAVTTNIVAPVFLIVLLGIVLKRAGFIDEVFVNASSKLVFSVALPALVFMKLSSMDFKETFRLPQILYLYAGILGFFVLAWLISLPLISEGRDRGVFIQGSFRSNYAIVGFALIQNMFGDHALVKASVILAFIMPLYNFLSILALTLPLRKEKKVKLSATIVEIARNPLILAAFVSMLFAQLKIPLHVILSKTGNYLSALALPLALIGIGGALDVENIKKASSLAFATTAMKLIFVPLILTYGAVKLGYAGEDLAVMFFLFASPTAIASFVMAEAMGGNSRLAGNIVVMSTLGSILTMTVGIFIMKSIGLF